MTLATPAFQDCTDDVMQWAEEQGKDQQGSEADAKRPGRREGEKGVLPMKGIIQSGLHPNPGPPTSSAKDAMKRTIATSSPIRRRMEE